MARISAIYHSTRQHACHEGGIAHLMKCLSLRVLDKSTLPIRLLKKLLMRLLLNVKTVQALLYELLLEVESFNHHIVDLGRKVGLRDLFFLRLMLDCLHLRAL